MASKSHIPAENCTRGLIGFSGGPVDFKTHHVWLLCDSGTCNHPQCEGYLAHLEEAEGVDAERREFNPDLVRVRSVKDLKRHLSVLDPDSSLKVLVAPKGAFGTGRPTGADFVAHAASSDLSAGLISARQAVDVTHFPLSDETADYLAATIKDVPMTEFMPAAGSSTIRDAAVQELSGLTRRFGSVAVEKALAEVTEGASGRQSVAAVTASVFASVAATEGSRRMSRASAVVRAKQKVIPSAGVTALDRRVGGLAPGRSAQGAIVLDFDASSYRDQHPALRFLDRGMLLVSQDAVDRAERDETPTGARYGKASLEGLADIVNEVVENGVFTHTKDVGFISQARRAGDKASAKHQGRIVEVRGPHPQVPGADLAVLLEVQDPTGASKGPVKARLHTVIAVPAADASAEVRSDLDGRTTRAGAAYVADAPDSKARHEARQRFEDLLAAHAGLPGKPNSR